MCFSIDPRIGRGFTLIELLIVVLIIAILAAIAVPNFLEFQTRAKVSRVRSDMRTLQTAAEAYAVDNNDYPPSPIPTFNPTAQCEIWRVTTPIAYISTIPADVFADPSQPGTMGGPFGIDGPYIKYLNDSFITVRWLMFSFGPDRDLEQQTVYYDPTNGTLSNGDIYLSGPWR